MSSTASSCRRPESFSTLRYETELDRLESTFNRQINTALTLVTTEKHALTQKFFETVAVQARRTFEVANRDVEQWLRAVMSPLETQVREYQIQLKRRLESVKRIHEATDTLENRVEELEAGRGGAAGADGRARHARGRRRRSARRRRQRAGAGSPRGSLSGPQSARIGLDARLWRPG